MIDIPCIIFAGGKSSRMGEDKSLLPFGGFKTLTEFQYSRLSKIFTNVYISCKSSDKFDFDAKFIEDDKNSSTFAPTTGFIAVFKALKTESFFALSVDSPFIDKSIFTSLINASYDDGDATIARTAQGIEPLCGVYNRSLLKSFELMQKTDTHKLGFLLKNSNTRYLDFTNETLFLNLNYPHEYQQALKILKTKTINSTSL
jgi:molybdopterin-guanine dinucleotide biosynthesis protein A